MHTMDGGGEVSVILGCIDPPETSSVVSTNRNLIPL